MGLLWIFYYMLLPSGSISSMVYAHLTGAIVVVDIFAKCVFVREYDITKLLLGG